MGGVKERWLRQQELGYSSSAGLAVCATHTDDPSLAAAIAALADEDRCDFCDRTGQRVAAGTDAVLDHMGTSLFREYAKAEDVLYWDEGEYVGAQWDIDEVLSEQDARLDEPFGAFVREAFAETRFAEREPYHPLPGEALTLSWDELADVVTHRARFFFADAVVADEDDSTPSGAELLEEVGRLIECFGLLTELSTDRVLWRVRRHTPAEADDVAVAAELGAPPEHAASQSRMSPAGIPMLYAADSLETALAETPIETGAQRTAGAWRPRRPCWIVDLTRLAPVPGIFEIDRERIAVRQPLQFLNSFSHALRAPVDDPTRVHTDYVPSQLVSEWLRLRFRPGGRSIDGLAWDSVKRPGTRNVVLWVRQEQCLDVGAPLPPWRRDELVVELAAVRRV